GNKARSAAAAADLIELRQRRGDGFGHGAVCGDVGGAVGASLDQARAGGERGGEVGERVEAVVGEVEEGGCLGGVDAARRPEQSLELAGVERLVLRQEVE